MQIIAGLILLAVLIVVHEFGHFIVAKLMGVRVLTFSVGFGPRLFGWKHGDTDYRVSAIPLGGYVSMYGDQLTEEIPESEKKFSFLHQPVWRKSLIAFAGPLFNFILPVFLFFFVFLGTEKVPEPVVGTVLAGQSAAQGGMQSGDRIKSIDSQPVESFQEVVTLISASPEKSLNIVVQRRNGEEALLAVTPAKEPDPNPLANGGYVGRIGVLPMTLDAYVAVSKDSPAYLSGLRTFDRVTEINGVKIASADELMHQMAQSKDAPWMFSITRKNSTLEDISQVITVNNSGRAARIRKIAFDRYAVNNDELESKLLKDYIAKTEHLLGSLAASAINSRGISIADGVIESVHEGSPAATLKLKKGDRIVSVNGAAVEDTLSIQKTLSQNPDEIKVVGVQSENVNSVLVFRMQVVKAEKHGEGPRPKELGQVFFLPYTDGPTFERHVGPGAALVRAFNKTIELIVMTLQSLWLLVSFQVSSSQVGGPIAIFGVAGQAAEAGAAVYVFVMALISVNLGLLNLLPIPVLDGGHLLMFGIEALQRKPLSVKTRIFATKIGMSLMLALMGLAIFNDLVRVFS